MSRSSEKIAIGTDLPAVVRVTSDVLPADSSATVSKMLALNEPPLLKGSELPRELLRQNQITPLIRALTGPLGVKVQY